MKKIFILALFSLISSISLANIKNHLIRKDDKITNESMTIKIDLRDINTISEKDLEKSLKVISLFPDNSDTKVKVIVSGFMIDKKHPFEFSISGTSNELKREAKDLVKGFLEDFKRTSDDANKNQ
jgi:hypothetical protein